MRAYGAHPERLPRGVPVPPPRPMAAWINKPPAAPALAVPEGRLMTATHKFPTPTVSFDLTSSAARSIKKPLAGGSCVSGVPALPDLSRRGWRPVVLDREDASARRESLGC
jgi:hypothetical protein